MMKIIGYLVSVVGIILIAISTVEEIKEFIEKSLNISFGFIPDIALTIAGIVIAIIGVLLVSVFSRGRRREATEVPIYRGNRIVGYRRH